MSSTLVNEALIDQGTISSLLPAVETPSSINVSPVSESTFSDKASGTIVSSKDLITRMTKELKDACKDDNISEEDKELDR